MTGPIFANDGICPICEDGVTFNAWNDLLRDHYFCARCGSISRERTIMVAVDKFYPNWRELRVHESSPANHGVKFGRNDSGQVQLSFEESPGVWSPWETLGGGHTGSSGVWSLAMVDLSRYAGKKVRVAFNLQQGVLTFIDAGWYIDEVYIKGPCIDNDGDGCGQFISDFCTYPLTDCNDADPQVNPGQTEIPGNGIDDNCDGRVDENPGAVPWLQLLLLNR